MARSKSNQSSKPKPAGAKPAGKLSQRQIEFRKHVERWESWQEEKRRLKREARANGTKMECHKKFDKFKNPTGEN